MPTTTNTDTPSPSADTAPLLDDQQQNGGVSRSSSRLNLRGAARFLSRATSRTGAMREPSVRVREAAAEQIEERQSDWAYSKPIVILDLIWNLAFIIASITVMVISRNETPSMPLRLWIVGYALQCVLHMVCVYVEYRKRHSSRSLEEGESSGARSGRSYSSLSSGSEGVEAGARVADGRQNDHETSVAKHLESANTMFSFIWWIIGFYWVSAGTETLPNESPLLYWLSITFLAFDVFFVVICVALACIIGIAVCCCLPCIIAILYAVAEQEGASEEVIKKLPTYKFQILGDYEKQNGDIQVSFGGVMTECDTDSPTEHVLTLEDAECCICLCAYEDGAELRELPCRHHFHSGCIDKWLHINATCPLCKLNILKCSGQSGSEEA